MPLPKSFTTITPLSKGIAMILFIILPLAGFYAGTKYGESIASQKQNNSQITPSPLPAQVQEIPIDMSSWKTYIDAALGFSFRHPTEWAINSNESKDPTRYRVEIFLGNKIPDLNNLSEEERDKFTIVLKKWDKKAVDEFQLYSKLAEQDDSPVFSTQDFYPSMIIKKGAVETHQMMYREANSKVAAPNYYAIRDAFFLKGDGDVVYIKPGLYVGEGKNFYDAFLSTFKFTEEESEIEKQIRSDLGFDQKDGLIIGKTFENFATISYSPFERGGYVLILKKANDKWTEVWSGHQLPSSCSDSLKLNIPKELNTNCQE